MDPMLFSLTLLTLALGGTTVYARLIGNDGRDVAFLGVTTGLSAVGTAVVAAN